MCSPVVKATLFRTFAATYIVANYGMISGIAPLDDSLWATLINLGIL